MASNRILELRRCDVRQRIGLLLLRPYLKLRCLVADCTELAGGTLPTRRDDFEFAFSCRARGPQAGGRPLTFRNDFAFSSFWGGLPFRFCFLKGWVTLLPRLLFYSLFTSSWHFSTAIANPSLPAQLPQSSQLPPTPFERALPIRISTQLIIILIDNR